MVEGTTEGATETTESPHQHIFVYAGHTERHIFTISNNTSVLFYKKSSIKFIKWRMYVIPARDTCNNHAPRLFDQSHGSRIKSARCRIMGTPSSAPSIRSKIRRHPSRLSAGSLLCASGSSVDAPRKPMPTCVPW